MNGNYDMLRNFKVRNFKCFGEELFFDLSSAQNYTFNPECVKSGIVNCAVVYGYNGTGKSNLGWAIFDIVEHLTDNNIKLDFPYQNYTNAFNDSHIAEFGYEFLINGDVVTYSYSKSDFRTLVSECFSVNGEKLISFDRCAGNVVFECSLKGTETLNKSITDSGLSVLKYVRKNSSLDDSGYNKTFKDFFHFVERMLFFRSLEDRTYIWKEQKKTTLADDIIKQGKVKDFEEFLNEANVNCHLTVVEDLGGRKIAFDFGKKKILYDQIWSTGTSSMTLFYAWYLQILRNEVSFLFIDEFDAFYHNELSRMIIKRLKASGVQFVLTTHNTSIMSNDLMRPDCYYLMNGSHMLPLSKCTGKELREAHNIEKIYRAGAFYVG